MKKTLDQENSITGEILILSVQREDETDRMRFSTSKYKR
jgi:hypothetical protein